MTSSHPRITTIHVSEPEIFQDSHITTVLHYENSNSELSNHDHDNEMEICDFANVSKGADGLSSTEEGHNWSENVYRHGDSISFHLTKAPTKDSDNDITLTKLPRNSLEYVERWYESSTDYDDVITQTDDVTTLADDVTTLTGDVTTQTDDFKIQPSGITTQSDDVSPHINNVIVSAAQYSRKLVIRDSSIASSAYVPKYIVAPMSPIQEEEEYDEGEEENKEECSDEESPEERGGFEGESKEKDYESNSSEENEQFSKFHQRNPCDQTYNDNRFSPQSSNDYNVKHECIYSGDESSVIISCGDYIESNLSDDEITECTDIDDVINTEYTHTDDVMHNSSDTHHASETFPTMFRTNNFRTLINNNLERKCTETIGGQSNTEKEINQLSVCPNQKSEDALETLNDLLLSTTSEETFMDISQVHLSDTMPNELPCRTNYNTHYRANAIKETRSRDVCGIHKNQDCEPAKTKCRNLGRESYNGTAVLDCAEPSNYNISCGSICSCSAVAGLNYKRQKQRSAKLQTSKGLDTKQSKAGGDNWSKDGEIKKLQGYDAFDDTEKGETLAYGYSISTGMLERNTSEQDNMEHGVQQQEEQHQHQQQQQQQQQRQQQDQHQEQKQQLNQQEQQQKQQQHHHHQQLLHHEKQHHQQQQQTQPKNIYYKEQHNRKHQLRDNRHTKYGYKTNHQQVGVHVLRIWQYSDRYQFECQRV